MIIYPRKLKGQLAAPPSKSMAHRAVICAALAGGTSTIENIELSEDIKATIKAVRALGAKVIIEGEGTTVSLKIAGTSGVSAENEMPQIDCSESGSTLRFMVPVSMAVAGGGKFTGKGLLPKRPMGTYKDIFTKRGAEWLQGEDTLPLEVKGKLEGGRYVVPGNISSQYITGLLLALPLAEKDSEIAVDGVLESKKYVDMTMEVMHGFGIAVEKNGTSYIIKGNKVYTPLKYTVEGDWSQAAFLILAGVLGEGVCIKGLREDSRQGDMAIVQILRTMGAKINWKNGVLCAGKSALYAADIDVSQCPDLAPAIALAMCAAEGKSTIYGGARLKIKESDRIMSVTNALNSLGAKVTPTDDGMIIEGVKTLRGGKADSENDHRIAMMCAVASSIAEGETDLTGKDSVKKSYPSFWEDFMLLGGKFL